MIASIVARLKDGNVKSVVPFGSDLPSAPYLVVGSELNGTAGGTLISVFAHFEKNQQIFLDDYIRFDVADLLVGFQFTTSRGATNIVEQVPDDESIGPLVISNDDGTISRERRFLVPDRI